MLSLKHIYRQFNHQSVLEDINITFDALGLYVIVGKSGSGKSTLLNIIAGLDDDYIGEVTFNAQPITSNTRSTIISYLMQSNDYLSYLTVKENIVLGCEVAQIHYDKQELLQITKRLKIDHLLSCYPSELSGGELKRMSLAKSLLKKTPILILDEPTGPLDYLNSIEVMSLLKEISKEKLVIVVSHDLLLSKEYADVILPLENHTIQYEKEVTTLYNYQIVKKQYPLWQIPIKQLLFDKCKYSILILFETLIIVSMCLLSTSISGINQALEDNLTKSVMCHTLLVSSKENQVLDINNFKHASYSYDTSVIKVTSSNKELTPTIHFLPENTKHIQFLWGTLPKNDHEVIVTKSFYETITSNTLLLSYGDTSVEVNICGIVSPLFLSSDELYLNTPLKQTFSMLENPYEIIIESTNPSKDYDKFNKKYNVFNDPIDAKKNYQSLIQATKVVGMIFIIVSIIISIILINEVTQVICLSHQHDYAYLITLGMSLKCLKSISMISSFLLGLLISFIGILTTTGVLYIVNNVYQINKHYYFSLLLNKLIISRFDLFVFVLVLYTLITFVSSIKPTHFVLSTDLLATLRDE